MLFCKGDITSCCFGTFACHHRRLASTPYGCRGNYKQWVASRYPTVTACSDVWQCVRQHSRWNGEWQHGQQCADESEGKCSTTRVRLSLICFDVFLILYLVSGYLQAIACSLITVTARRNPHNYRSYRNKYNIHTQCLPNFPLSTTLMHLARLTIFRNRGSPGAAARHHSLLVHQSRWHRRLPGRTAMSFSTPSQCLSASWQFLDAAECSGT